MYFFKKRLNSAVIQKRDIGSTYLLYNGYKFQEVRIQEGMEGKIFGLYVITKKMGPRIHQKRKKKKKK